MGKPQRSGGPQRGVAVECHDHIKRALQLSSDLLELANTQRESCNHDGCLLLDGVVRDSAWKIRRAALQWLQDLAASERVAEKN
jgi:hypothetical protein